MSSLVLPVGLGKFLLQKLILGGSKDRVRDFLAFALFGSDQLQSTGVLEPIESYNGFTLMGLQGLYLVYLILIMQGFNQFTLGSIRCQRKLLLLVFKQVVYLLSSSSQRTHGPSQDGLSNFIINIFAILLCLHQFYSASDLLSQSTSDDFYYEWKEQAQIYFQSIEMIKKQLKPISDHVKERSSSQLNNGQNQTTSKFNCDQLINDYLQFSLSGQMREQLSFTKIWMKNNKSQAKVAVRNAQKEVQKSLDQRTPPIKQFFTSGSKNMHTLIMSKPLNITAKMFNEEQMSRIITEREKSDEKCQRKVQHLKNIDNYLQQISKLNFKKAKARGKQNDPCCSTTDKQKLRVQTMTSMGKKTEESALENKTYDLGECKSLNCSEYQRKTVDAGKIGAAHVERGAGYHPFLENNLAMLYQSKKRNYLNKKFRLNKHKISKYY